MDDRWRIELFGGLEVRRGEHRIQRFPTRKTASLLAYLACRGEKPVAREVLAEAFWPENDTESSRNSLRVALNALRRVLEDPDLPHLPPGKPLLQTDRSAVSLRHGAFTTDLRDFESALKDERNATEPAAQKAALVGAVELYRGPMLAGWYEEWIGLEQARLAELYVGALRRLTSLLYETGDLEAALEYARRATRSDPLREEAHRLLIRLYGETGNAAAAHQQYNELVRILATELGAKPSSATRELIEQISAVQTSVPEAPKEPSLAARAVPPPLPVALPLTAFYGRETETATLAELLDPARGAARLVTMTGMGGTGKSRLAAEVAARLQSQHHFPAVWWVSLTGVTSGQQVPAAMASALQIAPHPDLMPFEQVVTALAHRRSLIILDNFEQLLEEGAVIVRRLLQRLPGVTVLVTSRQRLGIAGEREVPLGPLPTPTHPDSMDSEELARYPSVQLFIDRARAVQPDFTICTKNAATIARICERLDGLPLALELAAAWARVLSPVQILDRLSARFDLLVSLDRDTDPRHRSMRAVLEESARLMPEDLHAFFARLSVFRGGWTLDAARVVCGESSDVLEKLSLLQQQSLVVARPGETESRFRMLESVREYASGLLTEEEAYRLREARCAFYAAFAVEAEPHLNGVKCDVWLDRLDAEEDNLRAALRCGLRHGRERCRAASLASALWRYWHARGQAQEGYRYIEQVLRDMPLSAAGRPALLEGAGRFALSLGAPTEAGRYFREAVQLLEGSSDRRAAAIAATNLCVAARACGDFDAVRDAARLLVRLKEEEEDLWATSVALMELGNAAIATGDGRLAHACFAKSLRLRESFGHLFGAGEARNALARLDPVAAFPDGGTPPRRAGKRAGIAFSFLNLGHVAHEQGDYDVAVPLLNEALGVLRGDQDTPGIAVALERLGLAALRGGASETARAALEEAIALRRSGVGPQSAIAFPLRLLQELAGATLAARDEEGVP